MVDLVAKKSYEAFEVISQAKVSFCGKNSTNEELLRWFRKQTWAVVVYLAVEKSFY